MDELQVLRDINSLSIEVSTKEIQLRGLKDRLILSRKKLAEIRKKQIEAKKKARVDEKRAKRGKAREARKRVALAKAELEIEEGENPSTRKLQHIHKLYKGQKNSSVSRGHLPPAYTRDELVYWCMSQEIYHMLHYEWKESGFDSELAPSINRLDDRFGYSFNNIEIMTWAENRRQPRPFARKGIL